MRWSVTLRLLQSYKALGVFRLDDHSGVNPHRVAAWTGFGLLARNDIARGGLQDKLVALTD
jgi:hypothetical protein